jgi:stage V sporulation protein G
MEITEISVTIREEDKLKAFVNITFDEAFVIRGLKIIKGSNRYFISMPSRRMPDGTFRDIAHPIKIEFREQLEQQILEEYFRVIGENNQ